MEKIWTYWERAPRLRAFTQGAIKRRAAVGYRISATAHEASAEDALPPSLQPQPDQGQGTPAAGGTHPRLEGHVPSHRVRVAAGWQRAEKPRAPVLCPLPISVPASIDPAACFHIAMATAWSQIS